MPDTIEDLVANATAFELAIALRETLYNSPRTIADSELLGHLSLWIKYHLDAVKPITTDH